MASALLVVDLQVAVVDGIASADAVIGTIRDLVDDARARGIPVVWVRHDEPGLAVGSARWRIVPEPAPANGEPVVAKQHRSSFAGTGLGEMLRDLGVDHIVLTGAQSAFCVDMAGKHALAEGFDVTLVADGHCNGDLDTEAGALSDDQVRAFINRTWSTLRHPGAAASVTRAADVIW